MRCEKRAKIDVDVVERLELFCINIYIDIACTVYMIKSSEVKSTPKQNTKQQQCCNNAFSKSVPTSSQNPLTTQLYLTSPNMMVMALLSVITAVR